MVPHKWISALNLDRWADSVPARGRLPLLIRRLVHGTVNPQDLEHINFPAEEEGHRPNYDGETKVKRGNPKVPEGIAYWEMGVDKDVRGKLDGDYEHRIRTRGDGDFSQVTYVAVTPRDFQKKAAWAQEKNSLRQWKEVRVYDSDDLEQWLEMSPPVALWLAGSVLPHPPSGVFDLQTRWNDILATLQRKLPPDALLVGRASAIEKIAEWVRGSPRCLAITGHSPQEAVDVLTAWAASLPEPDQSSLASRALIIDNIDTWNMLAESRQSLILVAGYDLQLNEQMVVRASRNGHHAFCSVPTISSHSADCVKLERLDRIELEGVLRNAGLSEREAVTLSRQSAGSFTILKRRFSSVSAISRPEWSRDEAGVELAPLLLAGAWNEKSRGDQAIVSWLTSADYSRVHEVMNRWRTVADSPVRWINGTWEFVSPLDAWAFLHAAVTSAQLDRLEKAAFDVLGVDDPRLELPQRERWLAGIHGKGLEHSSELRQGLARTLALIGTTNDGDDIADTVPLAVRVDRIVRKVLPTGSGWKRWASLGPLLTLFAEASPDVVLESMEAGVADDCELSKLFYEEGEPLTGGAEHTGLLWALERLAWSTDYLSRTSIILAKLAARDPGGRLMNRPKASLRDIFFSWLPHTAAPLNERLDVLGLLKGRFPDVAWGLLLSLLPEPGSSIVIHNPPEWRYWAEQWRRGVTNGELATTVLRTVELLSDLLCQSPSRCIDLLPHLNRIDRANQPRIVHALCESSARLNADESGKFWAALRQFNQGQRYFADAAWALTEDQRRSLEVLQESLRPLDPLTLATPLFKKASDWIGDRSMSWQAQGELRSRQRLDAVRQILTDRGFQGVVEMAQTAELPGALAQAVFEASGDAYSDKIIPSLLGHANPLVNEFAKSYAGFRIYAENGREWAQRQRLSDWTALQSATFISQMPFDNQTWEFAAAAGHEVEEEYWQITPAFGATLPPNSIEAATRKFIESGRIRSAVDLVAMCADRADFAGSLQLELLGAALEATTVLESEKSIDPHDVHAILERLQGDASLDRGKLARVEWLFLPMLDGPAFPKTLQRLLSESADFFVEVLSTAYRPRRQRTAVPSPDGNATLTKAHAERAWRLLREWKRPPGMADDGTIDAEVLRGWVERMRSKAKECDRAEVADVTLGEVFAYAPKESDESWPCIAVREIIEQVDSPEITRGFVTGISNKRGAYFRSAREGGRQERDLAAIYTRYAEQCRIRWPRTQRSLMEVAHHYERLGKHEDAEVERIW